MVFPAEVTRYMSRGASRRAGCTIVRSYRFCVLRVASILHVLIGGSTRVKEIYLIFFCSLTLIPIICCVNLLIAVTWWTITINTAECCNLYTLLFLETVYRETMLIMSRLPTLSFIINNILTG